jgi:hypothetical protein
VDQEAGAEAHAQSNVRGNESGLINYYTSLFALVCVYYRIKTKSVQHLSCRLLVHLAAAEAGTDAAQSVRNLQGLSTSAEAINCSSCGAGRFTT